MGNFLAGVRAEPILELGEIDVIATRMLRRDRLQAGCDARDIAFGMGLEVCPDLGATRVDAGVLYYRRGSSTRDRDLRICRALARHVLSEGGIATRENVTSLTLALTRRTSGVSLRAG